MPRIRLPAAGLLVCPTLLFGCVAPSGADAVEGAADPLELATPEAIADDHGGAYAHLDAQRVDAWWVELPGERDTATLAVRGSTAPDNTYTAEVRALFGPLERQWTVAVPAVGAGDTVELSIPLAKAAGLDRLQADYTTELLVQVRAYGPDGALRDTRPLPVRHLLVDDRGVLAQSEAEHAELTPRGARGLTAEGPAPGGERAVETRVLPPLSTSTR